MSTNQNRTIITTTEPVTPLLLLSAMGREVNGICLEWISAPVDKHGETYDWKCGISADGRMHTAEAETGPLGVIEAALALLKLRRNQAMEYPIPKAESSKAERRPRRILIVGPEHDGTLEAEGAFELVARAKEDEVMYVIKNRYGPIGAHLRTTIFRDYGIRTSKTEEAP